MTEQELAVVNNSTFIAPVASVQDALVAYQAMKEFVEGILRKDVDFGTIPGTPKPTLYKPGAEKLMRFFGVSVELNALSAVEDWTGADHDGEAFFYYRYKATAFRGDMKIAEAVGSCSSWEKKYRYRTAEIKCPECGAENIRHSKNGSGWYCWVKTGGCGANFEESDTRITKQPRGIVPNPNPADLVNTIDKMAQKRAIVAAALLACNASEYFTQDIEDYTDGTFVPAKYNSHDHQGEVSEKEKPAIVGVWHEKDEFQPTKDQSTEDVQDGEDGSPIPVEVESHPEPEPVKTYDFQSRPYDPDTLKAALAKKVEKIGSYDASDKQRNLLGALLSEFYQDDTKRYEASEWLFDSASTKEIDGAMVKAALDWLSPEKDDGGAYQINEVSRQELSSVLTAALKAEGQEELL